MIGGMNGRIFSIACVMALQVRYGRRVPFLPNQIDLLPFSVAVRLIMNTTPQTKATGSATDPIEP